MLKTILLDLDDTLLDFARAEATALTRALTALGLPAGQDILARYHTINAAQWERLERGELTRPQVRTERFRLLFQELHLPGTPEAVAAQYEQYLAQGHFFIPGALELLAELAPQYDLVLVSNGSVAVQHGRLESAGISGYFRRIFLSEEVGANKPNREFFDRCFQELPGFSRQSALLVGDSLTSDILGGRNAGVRTCWFNPQGRPPRPDIPADYEIAALAELPPLLKTL